MKSQKRSPSDKALARGYKVGVTGKSRSPCPHESGDARHLWLSGWREGREDHWNGYNSIAQVQRLQNL